MSSLTDRPSETGHLTPEQLDELSLSSAAQDPHLAGCEACRSALADQIAVRRLLQQVPDPGPMPADVVARLDAALAGARGSNPAAATVLPMTPRDRPRSGLVRLAESRLTKSLVAAAAVALIAVGGYAAIQNSSSGASSTASSAGDAGAGSAGSAGGASRPEVAGSLDRVTVQATGTAYTNANIAGLVTLRLSAKAAPEVGSGGSQGSVTPAGRPTDTTLLTTAGLQSCLNALGEPTAIPLLVDLATFNGKPVAVVVLPTPSGGKEIWVVSRTCSPAKDGTAYYAPLR